MRSCGHVGPENDDEEFNYRNKDLLYWKKRDSFKALNSLLLKSISLNTLKNIEKSNENKVILAVQKARKGSFLNYEKSIKFNFIKTY